MEFEEIENLSEENMNALYDDIIEFGDEMYLGGGCCADGTIAVNTNEFYSCESSCRGRGSYCAGVLCYGLCRPGSNYNIVNNCWCRGVCGTFSPR